MTDLLFPVLGAGVVFLVAIPALALAARAVLAWDGGRGASVDRLASPWRYALIVGPVLAPLVWLVSAAAHQSELSVPVVACALDDGDIFRDVSLFGVVLFAIPGLGLVIRMLSQRGQVRSAVVSDSSAPAARVRKVCERNTALSSFANRVVVLSRGCAPVCTRGFLRPVVEIEAELVQQFSDEELEAVLLHEFEHARAGDPLRFLLAQVALTINPMGRVLAAEVARYSFAREALCDRRAVHHGADPLALANSIVTVAGLRPAPPHTAALGGSSIDGVRVRVQWLMDYATCRPEQPPAHRLPQGLLVPASGLLVVLPHVTSTALLDHLHRAVEALAWFTGLN